MANEKIPRDKIQTAKQIAGHGKFIYLIHPKYHKRFARKLTRSSPGWVIQMPNTICENICGSIIGLFDILSAQDNLGVKIASLCFPGSKRTFNIFKIPYSRKVVD